MTNNYLEKLKAGKKPGWSHICLQLCSGPVWNEPWVPKSGHTITWRWGLGTGVANGQHLWDLIKTLSPLCSCLGMSHPRAGMGLPGQPGMCKFRLKRQKEFLCTLFTPEQSCGLASAETECSSVPTLNVSSQRNQANNSKTRARQWWAKMPPSQSSGFWRNKFISLKLESFQIRL